MSADLNVAENAFKSPINRVAFDSEWLNYCFHAPTLSLEIFFFSNGIKCIVSCSQLYSLSLLSPVSWKPHLDFSLHCFMFCYWFHSWRSKWYPIAASDITDRFRPAARAAAATELIACRTNITVDVITPNDAWRKQSNAISRCISSTGDAIRRRQFAWPWRCTNFVSRLFCLIKERITMHIHFMEFQLKILWKQLITHAETISAVRSWTLTISASFFFIFFLALFPFFGESRTNPLLVAAPRAIIFLTRWKSHTVSNFGNEKNKMPRNKNVS